MNTDLWAYIVTFLNDIKTYLEDEKHIHLSSIDFSMPILDNGGLMTPKYMVLGHLSDTTGLTEDDQEGLDNLLEGIQQLEGTLNSSTEEFQPGYGYDMAFNITDAITYYVELTVQSLIAGNAANVLNKLGINQDTIEIAEKIIDIADAALFKINAIMPCIPKNIMFNPDFTSTMTSLTTSIKDMFMAMYISAENVYYETINQAITNLPSWEEIQKDLIDEAINIGITFIDQSCVKYTGHTLVELYYMCNKYNVTYKRYKEVRKQMRELEDQGYDVDIRANFLWNSDEIQR
jgi:hypothetical protein